MLWFVFFIIFNYTCVAYKPQNEGVEARLKQSSQKSTEEQGLQTHSGPNCNGYLFAASEKYEHAQELLFFFQMKSNRLLASDFRVSCICFKYFKWKILGNMWRNNPLKSIVIL